MLVCSDHQENTNIDEAARCLVEHIMNNEESSVSEREPTSILLSGYASTARSPLNCVLNNHITSVKKDLKEQFLL